MTTVRAAPTYRSGTQSVEANVPEASPEERGAALAFLQQLATEVSEGTVDLPCFPNVVLRISAALANPNTTSEHVVTIVGTEPRLAARLLQTANSAAFNPSGKPLTELRSAVTRIGQHMVCLLYTSCPNNGKRHPSSRLGGSREKRMTKTLKFLGAALLATLAAACGTSTKTSTGSSSITPGTLALDPPFRIASLNAAALGAELGASAAGAELLLSLIHI